MAQDQKKLVALRVPKQTRVQFEELNKKKEAVKAAASKPKKDDK